jgi:hypothetical protein
VNDPQSNEAPIPVPLTLVPPAAGPPATSPPTPVTPVPPITPSTIETLDSKWITHLSSLFVVSAAVAYFIGFIVVNSHLYKYGMVPYDFLQPRYLSAGLLYLGATVGLTSIVAFLIHLVKKSLPGDEATAEIKSAATLLGIAWLFGSSYLAWLLPKSENIEWWPQYLEAPLLTLAIVVTFLNTRFLPIYKFINGFGIWWIKHLWKEDRLFGIVLVLLLVSLLARLGSAFAFYPVFVLGIFLFYAGYFGFRPNQGRVEVVKEKSDAVLYGLSCIGFSIYVYAALTYPLISPHVGGGKPLLVSLSLKPEHRQTIGHIMGREDLNCVMHNISLIHENSEFVYVLPRGYLADDSAIAIPKSELISIAYQKKEKSEPSTCLEK